MEVIPLHEENGVKFIRYEFVTKGLPSGLGFDFLMLPILAGLDIFLNQKLANDI